MTTKKFLIIYFLMMLCCWLFLPLIRPPFSLMYDSIEYTVCVILIIALSFVPHIVGMVLAYKHKLINAWMIIVCYWITVSFLSFSPIGAIFVPQCSAWSDLRNIIHISIYVIPLYCATIHLIVSFLFLYILWCRNGKSLNVQQK